MTRAETFQICNFFFFFYAMESFSNSVLFPVTNCKHRALVNFRSKHECGTLAVGCRVKPDNENTKKKRKKKKEENTRLVFVVFSFSPFSSSVRPWFSCFVSFKKTAPKFDKSKWPCLVYQINKDVDNRLIH